MFDLRRQKCRLTSRYIGKVVSLAIKQSKENRPVGGLRRTAGMSRSNVAFRAHAERASDFGIERTTARVIFRAPEPGILHRPTTP